MLYTPADALVSAPASRTLKLATGLRYHVLEWGADDEDRDHTIVLVHGFLDLAWTWAPVVDAGLGARFHVIAPDMRGHGDSDWIGAGGYYHFMDYLADIEDIIDQRGRERVSLVGHSMGGSVCAYYAGAFPDRIHKLALLEGTGPPESTQTAPERIGRWLTSCRRARAKRRAPRIYADVVEAAAQLSAYDPRLSQSMALWLAERGTTPVDGGDHGGGVRFKHDPLHVTMGPYPFRVDVAQQFWRRIACPVLLVEGAESTFRHPPAEQARRNDCFADVQVALLHGAGHMMQRHQPAPLGGLLARFLSDGWTTQRHAEF
jgi:pimeloyl-ACP methyl ester carboxylesterase